MGRFLPTVVAAAALVLTGSDVLAATAVTSGAGPTPMRGLTGKLWILTTLGGKPPVKGTDPTIEFTATRRVSGSTGCNRYTGAYHVSGNTIRLGPLATTQRACPDPVAHQETAFLRALSRTKRVAVDGGKLTLATARGESLATFKAQTQALAGTSWDVLAYNNGKQAVVSVLAGTKITAVFGSAGSLTGFGGCNDYSASYQASPPKITIGPVSSTRKHCETPAGVAEQETSYLAALATAATYRVEGSTLELRAADGALVVELRRR